MLAYQLVEWQQPAVLHGCRCPNRGRSRCSRVLVGRGCHSDPQIMECPPARCRGIRPGALKA